MVSPKNSELLTVKDIAKRLDYSEYHFKTRILYQEKVADFALKISGKLRWREEDFQAWLESRKVYPE